MKSITTKHHKLNKQKLNELKHQKPQSADVEQIIDEEARIYVDGKLIAIYLKIEFDMSAILKACCSLKFEPYKRESGMITNTININFSPRSPKRDYFCRPSKLYYTNPQKHDVFIFYGKQISKFYRKYFKKTYANQIRNSYVGKNRIDEAYRIKGTAFTSGVINKDCEMNYHYDSANTKDGISCMLIMKENVAGGELILPELNIGFTCQDNYMLLFDGQKYLHGVTKIIKAIGGYRYTIVYYNNKGMHLCLPPKEEQKHYQNWLEKQSEKKRLTNLKDSK